MKILLIYPPWLRLFGLSGRHFPLNLGYLAAALRRHGHEPIIYQADFDLSKTEESFINSEKIMRANHDSYISKLHDIDNPVWQELCETIKTISPDIVGITSMTATYGSAINVARCVKRVNRKITVILGGMHPTLLPEETIKEPEVDFVVTGESEVTLVKLIEKIEKKDLSSIGTQYGNNKYVITPLSESKATDINLFGFPARDLLLNLKDFPPNAFGMLMGSRGCPFKCIFCSSHKMWGRKVRFRTASNIVEEITIVRENFGTENFHFVDDTFTLRKDLVRQFSRLLKEKHFKISWSCPTRVDFITPEIAREMKSAGCSSISLGIESGSEETLKKIRKNITLEQTRKAVKILKDEGVRVMGYFVFGFPWETERHFEMSLNLIEELDLDIVQYNFAVPLPGTELYQLVDSRGMMPPHRTPMDWSQFYQHSPCLPFPENINYKNRNSIIEHIETRIGTLNQKKAMLRQKKHVGNSRRRRYKYYLQHPSKLADRLYRLVVAGDL